MRFPVVHRSLLRFLPSSGELCLDVGAGSGRDASALARRGCTVVAVEPSDKLRSMAMKAHKESSIVWVDDKLPDLAETRKLGHKYKFILLSAVWMHLQPLERVTAITVLAGLLEKDGYLAITLRLGPAIPERKILPVSVNELLALASEVGLKVVYKSRENQDSFKRADVQWKKLVFSK